jgi:hypothetical protein
LQLNRQNKRSSKTGVWRVPPGLQREHLANRLAGRRDTDELARR